MSRLWPGQHLRPGVLQRQRPVEHQRARPRVRVRREVAQALELDRLAEAASRRARARAWRRGRPLRIRVEVREQVAARRPGRVARTGGRTGAPRPARRARPTPSGASPSGRRPSGASPPRVAGSYVQRSSTTPPRVVLDDARARDEVRVPQPHLASRRQAEELRRRLLHEVVALDPQLARERPPARVPAVGSSGLLTTSIVLDLALRLVLDHDLERVQDARTVAARCG